MQAGRSPRRAAACRKHKLFALGFSAPLALAPGPVAGTATAGAVLAGLVLLGGGAALFVLNFVIGGIIGGFVLVWRLLVAAWYVPFTIYRLIVGY